MARTAQSLGELEGREWPPHAELAPTSLVARVQSLWNKPLNQCTPDDLRLMISQQMGFLFLLPLALEYLKTEPLLEAAYYPGDLLSAVIALPSAFWRVQPTLRDEVRAQAQEGRARLLKFPEEDRVWSKTLCAELARFAASTTDEPRPDEPR